MSKSPSSNTPSPTEASTTPSPSPTVRPLSRFEGRPPVKVARKWAAAIGRDINDKDRSYRRTAPLSTKKAQGYLGDFGNEDIGLHYVGPVPFTPTNVRAAGDTAKITTCLWDKGWGHDPKTNLPRDRRRITALDFVMKKVGGAWKFDDLVTGGANCSNVPVKGLPW